MRLMMEVIMIKVVIFDFDGVLVDSNEAWIDVLNKSTHAAGVKKKMTYDDLRKHYGKPIVEIFKSAHPRFGHDSDALEATYSRFMELASKDSLVESFNQIGGIKQTLRKLKEKYHLAVGSGNNKRLLVRFLERLGLSKYFDMVVSGDDVENGKPSPEMLQLILSHYGVKPDVAVYVGDSESDVQAAKNAHVKSVVVLTGALSREDAEQLKPDSIVQDATKLPEVLGCM